MVAANYTALRNNLKSYCDMVFDTDETIIVTRKESRNVVMLSLKRYNEMLKEIRNAQYTSKINRAFEQLDAGAGTAHELIEE